MTREEKIKDIVERTIKSIKSNRHTKYDIRIFEELATVQDCIKRKRWNPKEAEEYAPTFKDFSFEELKKIRVSLNSALLEELRNSEDKLYIEIYRIIIALDFINIKKVSKIRSSNPKVKFCIQVNENLFRHSKFENLREEFKTIALLDKN